MCDSHHSYPHYDVLCRDRCNFKQRYLAEISLITMSSSFQNSPDVAVDSKIFDFVTFTTLVCRGSHRHCHKKTFISNSKLDKMIVLWMS